MSYYEKYVKYKIKYLKLNKKNKQQIGGDYIEGEKVTFTKKGNDYIGEVKNVLNDNGEKMYKIQTQDGEMYFVYEKNIKRQNGNIIKIERIEPRQKSKYDIGNIVEFEEIDNFLNEYKSGTISKKEYKEGIYYYKIYGPIEGKYTVNENNIIKKITPKELEEYRQKIIATEFNIEPIKISEHQMEYSNCIEDNCHKTTIEKKIGNLHGIKWNKECDIIITCEIKDNDGNMKIKQCKYFMDMEMKKNKILKCDNYLYLLHELKILKYIKKISIENEQINKIIHDHIIIIDEEYKISLDSFNYMLNNFKEQMNKDKLPILMEYMNIYNISNFNSNFRGIIMPHIKHNLESYADEIFSNENIIKSVFNILYCIYVLHNLLDIMHFNCDFENFCVASNKQSIQNYKIGNKYYTMEAHHCIKICNFDQSTKIKKFTNTEEIFNSELIKKQILCRDQGKCNKYNQKDIFIIISSLLLYVFDENTNKINSKMYEIILLITNYNYGLISAIIKNNIKKFELMDDNVFTSFCKYNLESLIKTGDLIFKEHECFDANIVDLDIDKILERYIEKYNDILGLIEQT
jgi:hypothetical protein